MVYHLHEIVFKCVEIWRIHGQNLMYTLHRVCLSSTMSLSTKTQSSSMPLHGDPIQHISPKQDEKYEHYRWNSNSHSNLKYAFTCNDLCNTHNALWHHVRIFYTKFQPSVMKHYNYADRLIYVSKWSKTNCQNLMLAWQHLYGPLTGELAKN